MPTPRQRPVSRTRSWIAPGRRLQRLHFEKTSFALSTMVRSAPNDRIEKCCHLPHDPTVLPRYSRSMPYSRCHTAVHVPPETGMRGTCETDIRGQNASDILSQNTSMLSANHPAIIFQRLKENGGARRDRTDDLMLAKHALSQLSYGPITGCHRREFAKLRT